jgi:hypothetical protein
MTHPEKDMETLGPEWTCMLKLMKAAEPDLGKWPLSAVYSKEDYPDLAFDLGDDLKFRLQTAQLVTFPACKELGFEPCGIELFGSLQGKGFDPGANDAELDIINEFMRNTDNWARVCGCVST